MKPRSNSLSGRYQQGLRTRLRGESRLSAREAESLGRAALSKGLETLDLAKIHWQALLAILPANGTDGIRSNTAERSRAFFMDVLVPIEKTHRAMVESVAALTRSNELLERRTADLTAANRHLRTEAGQKEAAQRSLRSSEGNYRALLAESNQMQRRLKHLSQQVLLAQENERKKISRELHNEIAQALTGINVELASLKIEAGASKKGFWKHIVHTQRLVEKSVNIVHRFARDLRPTLLDDLGLIPALQAYLKALAKRTGLQVRFSAYSAVENLSNEKRTVLYRVAQAALTNIEQHAGAAKASVALRSIPEGVLMTIKDDGKSFDAARVLDSRRKRRLGLIGMRERIEMEGGTFRVDSSPGRGTTISATLPLGRSTSSN